MDCDCCGHGDHYAGVASSGIGAFSISWCKICLGMRAEPKWATEVVAGELPCGEDGPSLIYYDAEDDGYHHSWDGHLRPIQLVSGGTFNTRTEAGKALK